MPYECYYTGKKTRFGKKRAYGGAKISNEAQNLLIRELDEIAAELDISLVFGAENYGEAKGCRLV